MARQKQTGPDVQKEVPTGSQDLYSENIGKNAGDKQQHLRMIQDFALLSKRMKDFNANKAVAPEEVVKQLKQTLETAVKGQNSPNSEIRKQSISAMKMVQSELTNLRKDLGSDQKELIDTYGKMIDQAQKTNETMNRIEAKSTGNNSGKPPKKDPHSLGNTLKHVGKHYGSAVFDNLDPTLQASGRAAGHLYSIGKALFKKSDKGEQSPKTKVRTSRASTTNVSSSASVPPTTNSDPGIGELKSLVQAQSDTLSKMFSVLVETQEHLIDESIRVEDRAKLIEKVEEEFRNALHAELTHANKTLDLIQTHMAESVKPHSPDPVPAPIPEGPRLHKINTENGPANSSYGIPTGLQQAPRLEKVGSEQAAANGSTAQAVRAAGGNSGGFSEMFKKLDAQFSEFDTLVKVSEETRDIEKAILERTEEGIKESAVQALKAEEHNVGHSQVNKAGSVGVQRPQGNPGILGLAAGAFGALAELFKQARIPELYNIVKDSRFVSGIKGFFQSFEAIGGVLKDVGNFFKPVVTYAGKIVDFVKDLGNMFGGFSKLAGLGDIAAIGGKILKVVPFVGTLISVFTSIYDAAENAESILGKDKVDFRDRIGVAIGSFLGGFTGLIDTIAGWFGVDTKIGDKTIGEWTKTLVAKGVSALLHPIELFHNVMDMMENAFRSIAKTYVDNMPDFLVPDGLKAFASGGAATGQITASDAKGSPTKPIEETQKQIADAKERAANKPSQQSSAPVINNVNAGTTNVMAAPLTARNDDNAWLTSFQVGIIP